MIPGGGLQISVWTQAHSHQATSDRWLHGFAPSLLARVGFCHLSAQVWR